MLLRRFGFLGNSIPVATLLNSTGLRRIVSFYICKLLLVISFGELLLCVHDLFW